MGVENSAMANLITVAVGVWLVLYAIGLITIKHNRKENAFICATVTACLVVIGGISVLSN